MGPNATDRLKRPIDGNQNRHRTAAPITNTARGDMKQTIPFPGRVQQFPIRPLHTLHKPILPAQTRYPPKSTPFIQRPPSKGCHWEEIVDAFGVLDEVLDDYQSFVAGF